MSSCRGIRAGRRRHRHRVGVDAGDGTARETLEELAAGLDNVEFVGHLDEPAPFLAGCDVLAMPSRTEALSSTGTPKARARYSVSASSRLPRIWGRFVL